MRVLVLKKTKSHKLDWMEYAIQRAFSQENDIVTFATIKVGGLLKTVTNIKELIKQYQPDVVIAKGLLASILFFELPKSIKKIINSLSCQKVLKRLLSTLYCCTMVRMEPLGYLLLFNMGICV